MKTKIPVLLMVFTMLFSISGKAAVEYTYEENFNSYEADSAPPADVFHIGGNGTVLIKELEADNKALVFELAPKNQYRINNIVPADVLGMERFVFEEKLRISGNSNIYAQFYAGMTEADAYKVGKSRIVFRAVSGNIQNHDEEVIIEDAYTPDIWFTVRTVFYNSNNQIRYDIHILDENGALIKSAYNQTVPDDFGKTLIDKGTVRIRNFASGDTNASGDTEAVLLDDIRIYEASSPNINNISVEGLLKVGVELAVKYDYEDDYGNADDSSVEWYRDGQRIDGAESLRYVLTEEDYQKNISVKITPKSIVSDAGEPIVYEVGTVSAMQGKAPEASELVISGTAKKGSELIAQYIYSGEEGIEEGDSQIVWHRVNESAQTDEEVGTGKSYIVKAEDEGSNIYFVVIPRDAEGTVGNAYKSEKIYIVESPSIAFTDNSFYSGFGSIKREINKLTAGTVSFEVTASFVAETGRKAVVCAMLMNGETVEDMIVFPELDWEYGQEKVYAGSFKLRTTKNYELRIAAYNSLDEMKLVSDGVVALCAE